MKAFMDKELSLIHISLFHWPRHAVLRSGSHPEDLYQHPAGREEVGLD